MKKKSFNYIRRNCLAISVVAFVFILLSSATCSEEKENTTIPNPKNVLKLAPTENNPRNSEGDFINLKEGAFCLCIVTTLVTLRVTMLLLF